MSRGSSTLSRALLAFDRKTVDSRSKIPAMSGVGSFPFDACRSANVTRRRDDDTSSLRDEQTRRSSGVSSGQLWHDVPWAPHTVPHTHWAQHRNRCRGDASRRCPSPRRTMATRPVHGQLSSTYDGNHRTRPDIGRADAPDPARANQHCTSTQHIDIEDERGTVPPL